MHNVSNSVCCVCVCVCVCVSSAYLHTYKLHITEITTHLESAQRSCST